MLFKHFVIFVTLSVFYIMVYLPELSNWLSAVCLFSSLKDSLVTSALESLIGSSAAGPEVIRVVLASLLII